eukprot:scaffold8178_cov296-Pinguiococcus_pyrenoidosus.AAC.3
MYRFHSASHSRSPRAGRSLAAAVASGPRAAPRNGAAHSRPVSSWHPAAAAPWPLVSTGSRS